MLSHFCSVESAVDRTQFFMFRTGPEASPSPCPFAGVHAFSYSTRSGNGAERCEEPASHLERCTQPERMVFRFSACPDVRGSESGGEYERVEGGLGGFHQ